MSFSVKNTAHNFEYNGHTLNTLLSQQASQAIRDGIKSGNDVIEFPKKLTLPLKVLGTLPDMVWQQVSTKINKK